MLRCAFVCLLSILSLTVAATAGESPIDSAAPLVEVSTVFGLCDGPAWDGHGALFVPDVKGAALYKFTPSTKKLDKLLEGPRISATFFNHGRLYVSDNGNARIAFLNGDELDLLGRLDDAPMPKKRPNDLVVDRTGGAYVTLTGQKQVVYLAAAGEQSVAVDGIDSPNGITMSPDEKILYVASYLPKKILAYDVTGPGKTANPREFAAMDDGTAPGADGMCIDAAGNVYCAGASDVWIWSPKGELLTKLHTPTRPINCAFGDEDLKTLYVTCFSGLYSQRMKVAGHPAVPAAPK